MSSTESLTCQQCHQPILLDPSFENLTVGQYNSITSSLPDPSSSKGITLDDKIRSLPSSSRESANIWAGKNGIPVQESFILLNDSTYPLPSTTSTNPNSNPNDDQGGQGDVPGPSKYPTYDNERTGINTENDTTGLSSAQRTRNLHYLISGNTAISHPLCIECVSTLKEELQKELDELSRERDAYINFEQGILKNRSKLFLESTSSSSKDGKKSKRGQQKNRDVDGGIQDQSTDGSGDQAGSVDGLREYDIEGTDDEWEELMKRKKELEEEEKKLILELKEREKELDAVRLEEERVKKDEEEVDREEEEFLQNHHTLSTQTRHLKNALQSAQTHLLLSTSLLQHLESTNVYNDAFQIGHVPLTPTSSTSGSIGGMGGSGGIQPESSGNVGTINGLRLGGRPIVDWEEINAAWGLVALALDRIAVRIGYTYQKYKIHPLGSYSKVEDISSKQSYELYSSTELTGFMQNRRYVQSLPMLLDCLKQLIQYGSQNHTRNWPIGSSSELIKKDMIYKYSIKPPGFVGVGDFGLPSMSLMGWGSGSAGGGAATSSTNGKDDRMQNDTARNRQNGSGAGVGGTGSGRAGSNKDVKGINKGSELSPEEQWTKACMAVLRVLKQILIAESEAEREIMSNHVPK